MTAAATALADAPLRDLLRQDIRLADVFYRHGMDFCCHGQHTVAQAAELARQPLPEVLQDLQQHLIFGPGKALNADQWPLSFLAEYVVRVHHDYTRDALTNIAPILAKVVQKHGERYPELHPVAELFAALAEELDAHLLKEEHVLFPYIKRLDAAATQGTSLAPPPFGSALNPVRMMEEEHEDAGSMLAQMAALTNNFTAPEGSCNTTRLLHARLQELDRDLRIHIHLENNVLFPRTLALEKKLLHQPTA